MKLNNKGFTLVELLVVLALSGLIITSVFSFFITNIKSFNRADDQIELQQQGQLIMGFIEPIIMESEGIHSVRDLAGVDIKDSINKVSINKIAFDYSPKGEADVYVFKLTGDGKGTNNLNYGVFDSSLYENQNPSVQVANYIDKIEAEPVPYGEKFSKANGVVVSLYLKKDGQTVQFVNQFSFRNYKGVN